MNASAADAPPVLCRNSRLETPAMTRLLLTGVFAPRNAPDALTRGGPGDSRSFARLTPGRSFAGSVEILPQKRQVDSFKPYAYRP
jgi:hypothetical protein